MKKARRAKKKAPFVDLYGVLLLIATLAMSIAYAEIVGTEITISTKAEATAQEGVFITDVICNESNSVSNNYMATTLDSSITLDSPTDTKNFTITIYNKTVKPYVFVGVKKLDKWDEFTGVYNNTNISYTFGNDMVPHETIVQPKDWIVFNVDLGFNGEGTMPETLRSLLNFSFQEIPTLEMVSEDTIENMYPNCEEKVYEFTVSNQRQDAEHGLITNGVPLTYTISPNVPAPLTAKIYDEEGLEVAGNKAITISSEAKEEQKYTMKVKWDNTNPVDGTPYNSASYAGQTLASSINAIATPNLVDGYDKYVGYTLDKAEPVEIKTAPLYFDVTTDKTTVEMNNDSNNAEKITLTVKNNNGTNTNIFETEYKISIDNSKFTLLVDGVELGENTIKLAGSSATTQTKELQLVSKDGQELDATENCNLTIEAITPYAKTETIALTIKDTTGPTAPTITGGTEGTYAISQTISVSEVSTDVGTGVGKYQYLLNDTESTETESIADVTTTATSQTFTEDAPGYYVYFRAVDNAGNPGEWSNAQQIYIDTAEPTVTANNASKTITQGASNTFDSLFTVTWGGITTGTKAYTLNNASTSYTNTSQLAVGTHTLKCTVTKNNGKTANASISITVKSPGPQINSIEVVEKTANTLKVAVDAEPASDYVPQPTTYNLTFPKSSSWPSFVGSLTQATGATYGFKQESDYLVSTNQAQTNTQSDSYITIDLRNYSSNESIEISVTTTKSAEFSDRGYVLLTESADTVTSYSNYIVSATTSKTETNTKSFQGGKLYYMHFIYKKDSSIDQDDDSFKINNITIELPDRPLQYEYNINNSGYTSKGYNTEYTYNNSSIPNTNTIQVRITDKNGKQEIKTLTYIKGITITENKTQQTVSVTWPSGSEKGTKQIKIGDGEWQTYTGAIKVTGNKKISARVISGTEWVQSEMVELYVIIEDLTAFDVAQMPSQTYGAKITNYTHSGDPDVEWVVYHSDGSNIYIITDKYVRNSYVPDSVNGTTPGKSGTYGVSFGTLGYDGCDNIVGNDTTDPIANTDERARKWWPYQNNYSSRTHQAFKFAAYLLDTDRWNPLYTNSVYADYSLGAVTTFLLVESYNALYGTEYVVKTQASSSDTSGFAIWKNSSTQNSYSINGSLHLPLESSLTSCWIAGKGQVQRW